MIDIQNFTSADILFYLLLIISYVAIGRQQASV
jgi:hypothetical protein